jgi:tetratricopeptide (TPR) repeat protein
MARPSQRFFPRRLRRRVLSLLIGTVLTLALIEGSLSVAYNAFAAWQARSNTVALGDEAGEVRVLCVGESTTAVAGDEAGKMLVPRTSYPTQLETILNTRQSAIKFKVLNNGMMGGTSGSTLELLRLTLPTTRPHMIIAMMGIKDTPNEWVPVSASLPTWMNSLRTVQLLSWLIEGLRLRQNAHVTDIQSFDDLPASAQEKVIQLGNYLRELRIADDVVAVDRSRAAIYLMRIGRLRQAEGIMREVTAERKVGYSLLAEILYAAGDAAGAETVLRDAMVAHPEEGMYSVVLADLLVRQESLDAADTVLAEALARVDAMAEPDMTRQYLQLQTAEVLLARGQFDEALAVVDRVEPTARPRYHEVIPLARLLVAAARGRAFIGKRDWVAAEESLLSALELSPGRHSNMWLLSQVYRETGQSEKEEEIRWKLLASQGRVAEYFELAKLFRLSGQPERVPEVLAMAVEHTPSLRQNYSALYALAETSGARLVVMQYPSFDLESLHLYAPKAEGVEFIDNLHVFDADPEGYFFEPTFPNSFSHYTEDGARVLAEHVADTVLRSFEERPVVVTP